MQRDTAVSTFPLRGVAFSKIIFDVAFSICKGIAVIDVQVTKHGTMTLLRKATTTQPGNITYPGMVLGARVSPHLLSFLPPKVTTTLNFLLITPLVFLL